MSTLNYNPYIVKVAANGRGQKFQKKMAMWFVYAAYF